MASSVEKALVESLAWLAMMIDETSDDELDPDLAVRWQEDALLPVDRLPVSDRRKLGRLCRERAAEVNDPLMRKALLKFVHDFDLEHEG